MIPNCGSKDRRRCLCGPLCSQRFPVLARQQQRKQGHSIRAKQACRRFRHPDPNRRLLSRALRAAKDLR